ncbi:hypothetical protein SINU_09080 [Sporolactobacillus inulinus CASD]|uniref:Uncharacterized protein n=1 Tax=Sporolactobacillus inulinus CASD TaxID=1069536 RepID=A0A0U1QN70_9BACL|nr:hypothetical protein SINU_09080 [Sporolactobacillus inulinus CASD]
MLIFLYFVSKVNLTLSVSTFFLSDTHSHNLIIIEFIYRFNVQALAQVAFLYTLRMNVDKEIVGSSLLINYDQDKKQIPKVYLICWCFIFNYNENKRQVKN